MLVNSRVTVARSNRLGPKDLAGVKPVGPGNWSADGRQVAFVRADAEGVPRLFAVSSTGGPEKQLSSLDVYLEMNEGTDRRDVMGGPQWSPTTGALAFLNKRDEGIGIGIGIRILKPGDLDGVHILGHHADDRSLRWSPDGRRIAFVGHRDGRDDLYVGEPGGEPAQLTFGRWDNSDPDWSPDGKAIAFISQRSDVDLFSNSICTIPAAGGDVRRLTHDDRANERSPRWSPDGQTIAFVSNREDIDDIWLMGADGSGLRRVTGGPGDKGDPQWSPDGSTIAYTRVIGGGIALEFVADAGGESAVVVSGGVNLFPRWSPDGNELLYSHSDSSHPDELWVTSPGAGMKTAPRQLTSGAGPSLEGIEFGPVTSVTLKSRDGLEITGLLYEPPPSQKQRGPAIVWVRGGPNAVQMDGWYPLLQFFAQRGYTVLAPNYRGSTGSGRAFMEANFGTTTGGDMNDWLGAADYLRAMPTVDPDRLAIMGRSYGGYAVLLALGLHPKEFRAGVSFAAPSNWFTYWEDCEISWGRRLHVKLMGLPSLNHEATVARCPVTYADRFEAPVLILHGAADWGVPCGQAREMTDLLHSLGKQCESIIYPGEGHVYSGQHAIADSAERIEAFLQRSLELA